MSGSVIHGLMSDVVLQPLGLLITFQAVLDNRPDIKKSDLG